VNQSGLCGLSGKRPLVVRRGAFAGFNVPGDANNFGKPEFNTQRGELAWVQESFAIATSENYHAIMLILQANPHFDLGRTNKLRAGFNELIDMLERESILFKKPVVLVHGEAITFASTSRCSALKQTTH